MQRWTEPVPAMAIFMLGPCVSLDLCSVDMRFECGFRQGVVVKGTIQDNPHPFAEAEGFVQQAGLYIGLIVRAGGSGIWRAP